MITQFLSAVPYCSDKMNLPVTDVTAAIPWYETVLRFQVVSQTDSPQRTAILRRGNIEIGLAENGGDPAQDGCFFEVSDVEAAFAELQANVT